MVWRPLSRNVAGRLIFIAALRKWYTSPETGGETSGLAGDARSSTAERISAAPCLSVYQARRGRPGGMQREALSGPPLPIERRRRETRLCRLYDGTHLAEHAKRCVLVHDVFLRRRLNGVLRVQMLRMGPRLRRHFHMRWTIRSGRQSVTAFASKSRSVSARLVHRL